MNISSAQAAMDFELGDIQSEPELMTPEWQGLLQQVAHLAQFAGDIQVVQGELGAGKSTFIKRLERKIPAAEYRGCLQLVDDMVADHAMLRLLDCLAIPTQPGQKMGQSVADLRHFVQQLHGNKQRQIVIIDDAHFLNDSILAAVASVMQNGLDDGFGLHLIMFAEPGVPERFDRLGFIDVSVHDAQLPPLSVKQTGDLLSSLAGKPIGEAFDAHTVHQIWIESKGLPGRIVSLAENYAIEFSDDEPGSDQQRGFPWWHLAAIFILLGVLLWGALSQKDELRSVAEMLGIVNSTKIPPIHNDNDVSTVSNPSNQTTNQPAEPVDTEQVGDEQAIVTLYESDEARELGEDDSSSEPVNLEATTEVVDVLDSQVIAETEPLPIAVDEVVELDEPLDSSRDALSALKVDEPLEAVSNKDAVVVTEGDTSKTIADLEAGWGQDEHPLASGQININQLADYSESALLDLPPDHYVLQVLSANSVAPLRKYLAAQTNKTDLLMYRGTRNGQPRFVVLAGTYADRSSALSARASLPKQQRDAGPWPKTARSVQSEILSAR